MDIIIGSIVVISLLFGVVIYNNLIRTKNSVEENKSSIDTIFQNRYDLIPNLIEVVKKYASHEKEVLEGVTKLRSGAMSGQEITKEKLEQENMLSGTLKSIFALSENYPDLKADTSFLKLQEEWTMIEDKMQAARRSYNSSVKKLNDLKETVPSNIVAGFMNLEKYPMFEADEKAKKSLDAKELF